MELRDYLRVYWKQKILILGIVVVATGTAVAVALTQPTQTAVSESFAINRVHQETTTQYQYDGYYALQAADLFAQTVVSWFSTPSVLREVYDQAGLDPEIKSINSLPARFSVRKYSAQNIVVKFTERNDERAGQVADALNKIMTERTASLNKTADGKSLFAMVGSTPVIAPTNINLWLVAIVTMILSFGLSIFIVAGRHYLKS